VITTPRLTISGTKDANVYVSKIVGVQTYSITYPTATTWEADVEFVDDGDGLRIEVYGASV
jgi:hypothetical protein